MLTRIISLAMLTIKEGVRHKVLGGIGLMAVVMSVFALLLPQLFSYDLKKVAIDLGLSAMSLSGLMIIFFLAVNILGRDIDKRTIYIILATRVSRVEYIWGKFLGVLGLLLISFTILSLLLSLVVYGITFMYPTTYGLPFSWGTLLLAQLFLFLELILIAAVVFFFSSFSSSFYLTILLGGLVYIIGTSIENIQFAMSAKASHTSLDMVGLLNIIKWIFPNLSAFDLKSIAAYSLPVDFVMLGCTALYCFIYVAILLFFTMFIFNKRELG